MGACTVLVAAQPNMCYPSLNKASTRKKGKCNIVTHTFSSAFGLAEVIWTNS